MCVSHMYDDITGNGQSTEEHDQRLEEAMKRIQTRGLTLNKEKCKSHMPEPEFMGHLLSSREIG